MSSPVTTTSYSYEDPLYYPTITTCVWSLDILPHPCPACLFEYLSCYWYNNADNTNNPVACPLTFTYVKHKLQACFEANTDTSNLLVAKKKGYLGSINMIFRIPLNYSDPEITSYRIGAVVNFRAPGSVLGDTFTETNYAIPGRYNLFTIRKTVYEKLPSQTQNTELPSDGTSTTMSTTSITYESTYSALKRLKTSAMTDNDYQEQIEIGFTFEDLSTKTIKEIQQKDGWNLFGEIAGMAGLLLGLDILKSFRIFLMFPRLFIRQTSLGKIWDALN